jgi:hypothetical protein
MDAVATPMAFVLTVIGGISLQSPEAVPLEACEALKVTYTETTCVDVEPECGKGTGVKCLGRADLDPAPAVRKKATRKRTRTTRYRRSSSRNVAVSQLVKDAF